jgi:AcrR family transcriptional regulator
MVGLNEEYELTIQAKPSKRAAYREATRLKLLAVARRIFMTRGVDAVSMDDIAEKAELSRATVYQHFSGMQVLLVNLLGEDWEGRERLFAQLDPGTPPKLKAVTTWLQRIVEGTRRAKGSFEMHRAALVHDDIGSGLHKGHRDRLTRLLFLQLRGESGECASASLRMEAAMIVAEIEYVATAAVTEWPPAETEVAIAKSARRLLDFAKAA